MGKTLTRDQFPVIYDHGEPRAVIVDVLSIERG
jgi:hypothetical protein